MYNNDWSCLEPWRSCILQKLELEKVWEQDYTSPFQNGFRNVPESARLVKGISPRVPVRLGPDVSSHGMDSSHWGWDAGNFRSSGGAGPKSLAVGRVGPQQQTRDRFHGERADRHGQFIFSSVPQSSYWSQLVRPQLVRLGLAIGITQSSTIDYIPSPIMRQHRRCEPWLIPEQ